jgi:F-type H+-transporting ATPase subunit b
MLDINASAVLTQAIAFILLVLFLGKFVFAPIGTAVDARQREIQETLDQIASDRRAMEQTRAEYEQRLANIAEEAREHSAREIHRAQEEAAALLSKARDESAAFRERALSEIDQERKKAVAQIRSEMADLAVIAASKILEKEIDPAVHRDLIKNVIGSVGASPTIRS